jgi:hypothetical protein
VVITGAQVFDEWFVKQPSTTRAEFCQRLGLPEDRPLVLYVCSSLLEGSDPEPAFVARWAAHLRSSRHHALRECNVLVRPHFRRLRDWKDVDLTALGNVACWPSDAEAPADPVAKTSYFDSLYHADAVVGINTSAMIEATIIGRPVFSIRQPNLAQAETVHFEYLTPASGGSTVVADSFGEHAEQLARVLREPVRLAAAREHFVRAFIKPPELDRMPLDCFADAVEALMRLPHRPRHVPLWLRPVRAAARRVARQMAASVKPAQLTKPVGS